MRPSSKIILYLIGVAMLCIATYFLVYEGFLKAEGIKFESATVYVAPVPVLDKIAYDKKLIEAANYGTTTPRTASSTPNLWPVKTVYPNIGAILPFKRIVAYYGNFYSTGMGVLGQYPPQEMLRRLGEDVKKWQLADPGTPVMPALDYIAVTAQGSSGPTGKYLLRMPPDQIARAIDLASQVNGIVILDIQVGQSNLQTEVPLLRSFLKMSQVHLAIDPEFSMKTGARPGTVIGTFDAEDVNYVTNFLANLVKENNLPPKILIVHRFTQAMVTHYKKITPLPEVEIVMDMDGWGTPARKINSYIEYIQKEPVQFTGMKLFYKNDLWAPSSGMMMPSDILKLKPRPLFIQYQ
ncbi:MAG: hypothetical protein HY225_02330 [Candidatus Vogelbacteria bacterium]|nr:hypothetical protein [Candidatus Vogelbacteria bacterium]